jgi:Phage integrase, N-terminal SAM-like domain
MTTGPISPLRQRMIEDMSARKLGRHSQRSHLHSCERFAAFLKRSPETAAADDVRRFQLHLIESGASICNRNRIMTGVKFLLRVTLRRHDLAAEIYHIKEPLKLPLILSPEEAERLLAMADGLKIRVMLALGYGCGLRASEIVRLKGWRHRQRPEHHPDRAVQGAQGPACDAAAGRFEPLAAVVEGAAGPLRRGRTALGTLAVSRPQVRQAANHPPTEPAFP